MSTARLPLASTLKNRASTTDKGARLLNAYVEIKGDPKKGGIARVVKRPCLDSTYEAPTGLGQLLFTVETPTDPDDTDLVVITDDVVTTAPSMLPKRASFFVQPSEAGPTVAIDPAIVVRVLDKFGNVLTSFNGNVTLSMAANPAGGVLSGTLTVAASSGVATFSNVKVSEIGEGYRLRAAASGVRPGTSNEFEIAAYMSFQVEPSDAVPEETIKPPVKVRVLDVHDDVITSFTGDVTIELGANPGEGELTGTLTVAAVSGVATFNNLTIDEEGEGYTLVATSDDIDDVESAEFDVASEYEITLIFADGVSIYDLAVEQEIPVEDEIGVTVTAPADTFVRNLSWGTGWHADSVFTLINETLIRGVAGVGGAANSASSSARAGTAGGPALSLNGNTVSIDNTNGEIFGGGGGGGAGGTRSSLTIVGPNHYGSARIGAGGGGGFQQGAGGSGIDSNQGGFASGTGRSFIGAGVGDLANFRLTVGSVGPGVGENSATPGTYGQSCDAVNTNGANGGLADGGAGGTATSHSGVIAGVGGSGGPGGGPGEAGTDGTDATGPLDHLACSAGLGGAAGKAIALGGGTVIWLGGNNPDQVKGAVS